MPDPLLEITFSFNYTSYCGFLRCDTPPRPQRPPNANLYLFLLIDLLHDEGHRVVVDDACDEQENLDD
jgi:hypothetical protein